MGLMDVFKATENKQLQERVAELESLLSPEQQDIMRLRDEIRQLEQTIAQKQHEADSVLSEIDKRRRTVSALDSEIAQKRSMSTSFDEQLMFESFGLYTPRYHFARAEQYKKRLDDIRKTQKDMISSGVAVLGSQNWTVNGSASQGQKMVKDMQKLLLRAFNGECDDIVEKVKYNNFDTSIKRIRTSRDAISKLGSMMSISISEAYCKAKIEELTLAFEYATKKQQEKEAEKEERARLKEEARLQKEIEEERRRIEKEQTHYLNALAKLNVQLAQNPTSPELLERQAELQGHIEDAQRALEEVDYREANKRAGYVYVISNVGAFGENVYKIGMTRRLDPQERVDELGDASVPFNFDVHAMIFTDDAPKLEAALHKAFEDKKVNMVNPRREFFHVTLDEIKAVIRKNYDKTVEFVDYPDAEQWRVSARMRGETVSSPVFPQAVPTTQSIPAPTRTPSRNDTAPQPISQPTPTPTNLATQAIEIIKVAKPAVNCIHSEKDGVFTVSIMENSQQIGRLRLSCRKRLKCDYFGADGKTAFFGDMERIKEYIN